MKNKKITVCLILLTIIVLFAVKVTRQSFSTGEILRINANNTEGFYWTYYLYVPKTIKCNYLLVIPNNTGIYNDINIHEYKVEEDIKYYGKDFAEKLGVPLLMPVFPRDKFNWKIYTHALDRDTILENKVELKRLDIQLINMIDDAKKLIEKKGIEIDRKVLFFGYSASGMFVNRFTIMHPDIVKAAAIGSPGGFPILPIEKLDNKTMPYPIGIGDLNKLINKDLDLDSYKKIPQFFFVGEKDDNDSVIYADGFEPEYKDIIFKYFGDTPSSRLLKVKEIYKECGTNATFIMYNDVGHKITQQMKNDVVSFFIHSISKN